MARPASKDGQRTEIIAIRVHPGEKEALETKARKAGLPVAVWLRTLGLATELSANYQLAQNSELSANYQLAQNSELSANSKCKSVTAQPVTSENLLVKGGRGVVFNSGSNSVSEEETRLGESRITNTKNSEGCALGFQTYEQEFEEFWAACPRQISYKAAKKEFLKVARSTSGRELIEAMKTYAAHVQEKKIERVFGPEKWLKEERWRDKLSKPAPVRDRVDAEQESIAKRFSERMKRHEQERRQQEGRDCQRS